MNLSEHIRPIPDFPKPGILFRDITPLLAHPEALKEAIQQAIDLDRFGNTFLILENSRHYFSVCIWFSV